MKKYETVKDIIAERNRLKRALSEIASGRCLDKGKYGVCSDFVCCGGCLERRAKKALGKKP